MTDELLQLCPVQYIEGINENEKLAGSVIKSDNPQVLGFKSAWGIRVENAPRIRVAIAYNPGRVYTLCRIEIVGLISKLFPQNEHLVRLCTDYKTVPGENSITYGKLIIPDEKESMKWLELQLEQPVVVFDKQAYWIILEVAGNNLGFAFGQANDGDSVAVRMEENGEEGWSHPGSWGIYPKLMLKFYGRVLPVNS